MLRFKRGDSVIWPTTYSVGGHPVDLTDYEVTSQVRTRDDRLIATFTIEKADQSAHPGHYTLSLSSEDSASIVPGAYMHDIQYAYQGIVQSTATIPCIIDADQTR